ncbi:MAG: thioredoxin family protein [Verrucomicrobia bacterium]|nr:thioredoxin family protein [Verrucomicrobiota bacterium]
MKKLQILGTGCAKCTQLAEATEHAAQLLGVPYEIEKVTEIQRIMAFGVMRTPALVVDGVVKASGRLPSSDEIRQMIQ